MKVHFYTAEDELGERDWPCPPRVNEEVCLFKEVYVAISVQWCDHVKGDGTPIRDDPGAYVYLVLKEGKKR